MARLLCHCLVVDEAEVRKAIRGGAHGRRGRRALEAGTGCGSCRAGIAILLEQERRRPARAGDAASLLAQLGLFRDGDGEG
ncbi:MAG: (2Fe-2S)-binding protein [Nannocystaceae bacterium]